MLGAYELIQIFVCKKKCIRFAENIRHHLQKFNHLGDKEFGTGTGSMKVCGNRTLIEENTWA
jgi:hypothetical protein